MYFEEMDDDNYDKLCIINFSVRKKNTTFLKNKEISYNLTKIDLSRV